MDDLAISQLHSNSLALFNQHFGHARFVANRSPMALQAFHKLLRDHPHPTFGIVDPTRMTV